MFFYHIDFLSPKVTLYYNGLLSHSSIISIFLSIISIIFIIILAIYFFLDIILKKNPSSSYFNVFNQDAGIFEFNKTSFFHFINILQIDSGDYINEEIDFTIFNIIGNSMYIDNYLVRESRVGIQSMSHWIYGFCDKNVNTEGLNNLLTYNFFEKSACIKKYYNSSERQYYDIGHPKFVWPEIAHGTFNDFNKLYGIYIQKCNNKTIKHILGNDYNCKSDSEIDKYFSNKATRLINLYFINNYINILDYKNPNNKFFYKLETPLEKEQYTHNDINFNPSLIRTHKGLFLDSIKDEETYMFDRNDVYTGSNKEKNLYVGYCFFLKNMISYYERSYKKIQDILSSLGGISQTIYFIAFYLNYLYNNYIILSDTKILLNSFFHKEENIYRNKTIVFKDLKNGINKLEKNKKDDEHKNNFKDKINNNDSKIIISHIKEKNEKIKIKNDIIKNPYIYDKNNNINIKDKELFFKEKNKFLDYFCYIINCKKKKKTFRLFENFRIKVISEENLIKANLNINNILKMNEKKSHIPRGSYLITDITDMMNLD